MTGMVVSVARQVSVTQAKAQFMALLNDVAGRDEVEITKHGLTATRLVPAVGPAALRGRLAGIAVSAADDELLFTTGEDWESGASSATTAATSLQEPLASS